MENQKIEYNTDNYLSGWEDEDRDRMRDFMGFMYDGYNQQLDSSPNSIKDEVEYLRKVYKFYIWDRIKNHYLISLLIDDREGRLNTPISEMTVEELEDELIRHTTQTYNNRVLNKGIDNWYDKVELDGNWY